MENLNIDQYLNKVDGNTLPASEWNACLTAVQTKVNELVGVLSDGIGIDKTEESDSEYHNYSMRLDSEKVSFYESGNDGDYIDSTLNSDGLVVNPANRHDMGTARYSTYIKIKDDEYEANLSSHKLKMESEDSSIEISPNGITIDRYEGITQDITIGDYTYKFVNGILVQKKGGSAMDVDPVQPEIPGDSGEYNNPPR